ncbi:uncharacterized protein LOC141908163 [Tubulanus polymorphus]|uniref:uncharacterized protein LOC141908163 n=1 Tax=Tubulanus polymorphus TaxID=672921 RepID=UPI003DA55B91
MGVSKAYINSAVIHAVETGNKRLIVELRESYSSIGAYVDVTYLFTHVLHSTSRLQVEVAEIVDALFADRMKVKSSVSSKYLRFVVENGFYVMIAVLLRHAVETDYMTSMRSPLAISVICTTLVQDGEEAFSVRRIRELECEFESKGVLQTLLDHELATNRTILEHYGCKCLSELVLCIWYEECSWGREEIVRPYLVKYPECRLPDQLQKALLLSGRWGHSAVVKLLISYLPNPSELRAITPICDDILKIIYVYKFSLLNLNPEWIEARDETLFNLAIKNNCVTCTEELLEIGWPIDYHFASDQGKTSLHLAVQKGYIDMVRLLSSRGADIDAVDSTNRTPLHIAVKRDRFEIVKFLLANDADISLKDWMDQTALHTACIYQRHEIIELLVEHGADINSKGHHDQSPISIACALVPENLQLVRYFVEAGADVDQTSQGGMTPLAVAARNGYAAVTKLLLENGADARYILPGLNESILLMVCRSYAPQVGHEIAGTFYERMETIISSLIDHGARPNPSSKYNAFVYACLYPPYLQLLKSKLSPDDIKRGIPKMSLGSLLASPPAFLQNTFVMVRAIREIIDLTGGIGDIRLETLATIKNYSLEIAVVEECCGYLRLEHEKDRRLDAYVRAICKKPYALEFITRLRECNLLGETSRTLMNRVFCDCPSIPPALKKSIRESLSQPLTLSSHCRISFRRAVAVAGRSSVVNALSRIHTPAKIIRFIAWRNIDQQ